MAAININGNVIDPANPRPGQLPADASNTKFIVLQCSHRLSVEEYDRALQLGVQILSIEAETPSHTSYLCRYDKDDLKALETLDFVQHALVYVSDFVTEPSLKGSVDTSAQPPSDIAVTIRLHDTTSETGHDLFQEIKRVGYGELIDADDSQLRVRLTPSSLAHITDLDYVKTIERTKVVDLRTTRAHGILAAGRFLSGTSLVLRGKGEVIAVADTGLDIGKVDDIHPAFKVGGVKTGVSRVKKILNYTPNDDHGLDDSDGHGTHVAACAVGALEENLGEAEEMFNVNNIKAPASEADLVFQVIHPGSNTPNLKTLFLDVSLGLEYNAKIHSNSWGSQAMADIQNPYTTAESELIDRVMELDRELLILWGAGNDGHKLSKHGIGGGQYSGKAFVRQIGTEAAAKNVVTVGGTLNARRITDSTPGKCFCVDGDPSRRKTVAIQAEGELWLGSSKGPTCELRLKPDVVAPAVSILSARSRQPIRGTESLPEEERESLKDEHFGGDGKSPSRSFRFMSGTSQATPLVAGCAAVLRQALKSRPLKPIANPSGTLIKALLVNGARDLRGRTFKAPAVSDGTPTEFQMPPSPNTAQGFGEVDLERSLKSVYPAAKGEGDANDYPPLAQGKTDSFLIDVPAGKNNVRVTMAYNDKPGAIIADKLSLTVACQTPGAKTLDQSIQPDPIVYLPWQRNPASTGPPPNPNLKEPATSTESVGLRFTHNNVQRISCSVAGKSKVEVTVAASAITPPNSKSLGHAVCWLFY
jgi:subtilisin family serine protease